MHKAYSCILTGILVFGPGWWQQAKADFLFGIPRKLGLEVNSGTFDVTPSLSRDGKTLYFSSRRPGGIGAQSLWQVTRETSDAPWTNAVSLSGIGGAYAVDPTVTADGLELYFGEGSLGFFGSARPGGEGDFDIWVSKRATVDDPWREAENVGPAVNSSSSDESPAISADGLSLYFTSNRPGGFGQHDIYVSRRQSVDAPWEEAMNLGPVINSASRDWMDDISADGLSLLLDSDRPGATVNWGDTWVATRESAFEEFGTPIHLPPTVTVGAGAWGSAVSPDGSALYYTLGSGNDNIWEVPLLPFESVVLSRAGETYSQDFDQALAVNRRGEVAPLPAGWSASADGVLFESTTTRVFPAPVGLEARTYIYSAGAVEDSDRALAVGVPSASERSMLQLLVDVSAADAAGFQLQFDLEAWDAARRADSPGEAAFDVTVEADSGSGFAPLMDFGTVTTGAVLQIPSLTERVLTGNEAPNRVRYDSGRHDVDLAETTQLRIRWAANREASTTGWIFGLDNVALTIFGDEPLILNAGDADQDLDFDQIDLIQVQQAAKYLTGQSATWGEGDWNAAPGGEPGDPPVGDGVFNQIDIIAAQQAGVYLTGPYAAVHKNGQANDGQASIVYYASTGELQVDAPSGTELTSINIDSSAGIFTASAAENLGGSFDNDADDNIFKATFGSSFGSLSFGNVAPPGLSEDFVLSDLTVIGSLAGGGDLGNVDLVYVPEPTSLLLLCVGLTIGLLNFRLATR